MAGDADPADRELSEKAETEYGTDIAKSRRRLFIRKKATNGVEVTAFVPPPAVRDCNEGAEASPLMTTSTMSQPAAAKQPSVLSSPTPSRRAWRRRETVARHLRESYTRLIHDVVVPGAKEKHSSAVASVPTAASVSPCPNHAVGLVFVN